MTVTKKGLADHLADMTGLKARESKQLVESFFNTIRETLASGEDVKLSGFGNFTLHGKRARPGRNPKNGEPFEIRARRVVTFRVSPTMAERCNEVPKLPAFGKARALAGVDNGQILSP